MCIVDYSRVFTSYRSFVKSEIRSGIGSEQIRPDIRYRRRTLLTGRGCQSATPSVKRVTYVNQTDVKGFEKLINAFGDAMICISYFRISASHTVCRIVYIHVNRKF